MSLPGFFAMSHKRMTTNELLSALDGLKEESTQDLIKELQVHQLELEIQNRELRETEKQLALSRVRYADLYDFSPIGYASLNEHAVIEEINIAGGKLLGDNAHKLIGRSFTDFVSRRIFRSSRSIFSDAGGRGRKRTSRFVGWPPMASPRTSNSSPW